MSAAWNRGHFEQVAAGLRMFICASILVCVPIIAEADARLSQLLDALRVRDYVAITQQEGMREAPDLAESFLGYAPDTLIMAQFERIYDAERMFETVREKLDEGLPEDQRDALLAFLQSATGEKIMDLELAARRAMSDPQIEEIAKEAWAKAPEQSPWLVARIEEIITISDLVDRNVTGALNSNLRFFQGLADGAPQGAEPRDVLAQVWAQEPEIRKDTTAWLGGYLLLAYQPLSEKELTTYVEFWQTVPGRTLNSALFEAFNTVFDGVSYATARVLALYLDSEEL